MDEGAFAAVAQEYGGRLFAVAYRLLRNRVDAEDAVQRALMKAFAALDSYSPQWAISTWLYRVLSNVCIDELRRRPHRDEVARGGEKAPLRRSRVSPRRPADDPSADVDGIDLARALEGVPREARLLMALHYVDGLSYGELASAPALDVDRLVAGLGISATARGVRLIRMAPVPAPDSTSARRIADLARREIAEYLEGRRAFFSVPVDLSDAGAFQSKVLAEAARIPFGGVVSYAELADRIGYPRAARAVGNALGANPVPLILPCHRIIRGDGTWGQYLFGPALRTRLLALERATPALVGSTTTRVVCRHGCPREVRTREDRRVVFASVEDARSVGYRPCPSCRP